MYITFVGRKRNVRSGFCSAAGSFFLAAPRRRSCFLTPLEPDLVWPLQVNQGRLKKKKKIQIQSVRSGSNQVKNAGFLCSCRGRSVFCVSIQRGWTIFVEEKGFLVHNVEQRETAIVLVKLYEYSVNMCQQRQHYFKNYVWRILAVYIDIY